MKNRRARLDADKTAKPRTRIVTHVEVGERCSIAGPGIPLLNPEYVDDETGERTPLVTPLSASPRT